jgi:large subunit ribosomal protein L18
MNKIEARKRRGAKTRAMIRNNNTRPRLTVFRSSLHIYAQIIERGDTGDRVLVSASTLDKELKAELKGNKRENAKQVGQLLAKRAKEKNISEVAFDRAGYKYHGRVKELADGAREGGINF